MAQNLEKAIILHTFGVQVSRETVNPKPRALNLRALSVFLATERPDFQGFRSRGILSLCLEGLCGYSVL